MCELRVALAWLSWLVGLALATVVLGSSTPALLAAVHSAGSGPDDAVAAAAALTGWAVLGWLAAGTALTVLAVLARTAGTAASLIAQPLDRLATALTPTSWGEAVRTSLRWGVVASATGGALLGVPAHARPAMEQPVLSMPSMPSMERMSEPASDLPDLDRPETRATYLVRPGDCLWSIAERAIGPEATHAAIARAWPRWWRANRSVIGPDPAVIHPGQRLVVPGKAFPS